MPLAIVVDKIEDVPEALRGAYVERDGKFYLDAEIEDVTALKDSVAEERTKREAAERLATKASNELKKLENKQKAESAGLNDEQLKQLREDVRNEVEAEFAPFKADAEKYSQENRELKLDSNVKALALGNGVRKELVNDWWELNKTKFDLTDDGKPVAKDHPGKAVAKFIAEDLKAERPYLYEGTKASGGGANGGAGLNPQKGSDNSKEQVLLSNPTALMREANDAAA